MRKCTKCQQELPLTSFYWRSNGQIVGGGCKTCIKAKVVAWQRSPKGYASHRAATKKYDASPRGKAKKAEYFGSEAGQAAILRYVRSPKYNETRRARYHRSDKVKQTQRAYYHSGRGKAVIQKYLHTEKGHTKSETYKKSHARKVAVISYKQSSKGKVSERRYWQSERGRANAARANHKRQGLLAAMPVFLSKLTAKEWQEIQKAYGFACVYCKRNDKPLTRDCIIPVTKGGFYTKDNVVPACRSCNARKGNRQIPLSLDGRPT